MATFSSKKNEPFSTLAEIATQTVHLALWGGFVATLLVFLTSEHIVLRIDLPLQNKSELHHAKVNIRFRKFWLPSIILITFSAIAGDADLDDISLDIGNQGPKWVKCLSHWGIWGLYEIMGDFGDSCLQGFPGIEFVVTHLRNSSTH